MMEGSQVKLQRNETYNKKKNKHKIITAVYERFLSLFQIHPHAFQDDKVPLQIQQIYDLVKKKPQNRTHKLFKKIVSILIELKCFKNPPQKHDRKQFLDLFKRDNNSIVSMIAPFIQITKYSLGEVIQITSLKRNSIKILLIGEVTIFQPINYNSFKLNQSFLKDNQTKLQQLIYNYSLHSLNSKKVNPQQHTHFQIEQQHNDGYTKNKQSQPRQQKRSQNANVKNYQPSIRQTKQVQKSKKILTKNECKNILNKLNIVSHQISKYEPKFGNFVADKNEQMFIDQKPKYSATAICSSNCVFLEISYQIAKQVINLINNDEQRPFLQALLIKFPMLEYFEAKQYVSQDYILIRQEKEQDGQLTVKITPKQVIKQLQTVMPLNYQIAYNGELFLIIKGSVTLIINQVSERRPSSIDLVIPQRRILNKQLISLYDNELFGFQEIGKNKAANLRYLVASGSKILRINQQILQQHMQSIEGFEKSVISFRRMRNQIISKLLISMQSSLQTQQIQRHQAITFNKGEMLEKIKKVKRPESIQQMQQIKQVKYYGHQNNEAVISKINNHFSPQNTNRPKQAISPEIAESVGLGLQFSSMLIKRQIQKINIKDGMIEITDKQGNLLRKKKLNSRIHQGDNNQSTNLLKKIGVLSSKQVADHNFKMVKKRKSKYQFEDLDRQLKQFKKIREKSQSLPKLTHFFAKKQERVFEMLSKKRMH